ncbi:hypothetical protein LCL61_25040 [Amycolatopsis coloradensis]|uniref:Uncharacterized protein n=1 Tax=Amycolatopsis coloradensis TaxID=76021 RepID=A0ACD5BHA6_9PSEU
MRTNGFDAIVAEAAALARKQSTASEAARVAATLDGRIDEETGIAALSRQERGLLEEMVRSGIRLEGDGETEADDDRTDDGWWLWLTATGRLAIRQRDADAGEGGYRIGKGCWPTPESLATADRLARGAAWAERSEFDDLAAELAQEPPEAVVERLNSVSDALVHLAPVRIYVGDRTYSNLGSHSNLPGKSLAVGAPDSVLTELSRTGVAEWRVEDAVFVACAAALLKSGTAVRLEEFNSRQLTPSALEAWLRRKTCSYSGLEIDNAAAMPTGGILGRLDDLAVQCAARRSESIRSGQQFYRYIQGVNLYKEERPLVPRVGPADLPAEVVGFLREEASLDETADGTFRVPDDLARALAEPAGDARFGSAFEQLLHGLLGAVAEATDSDVTMARGPRCLDDLADGSDSPERVLRLTTNENYCCVVPSHRFRERFADDRASLIKALASYSARMRYNTWHYLPDSMGLGRHHPGRDDWFFAPSMPDITTWSDQHHTGHVMFGVRHAIRVPIGIHFDGSYRPGLYDLRLMRAEEPPFELVDLRAAVAVGQMLTTLHQAMAAHRRRVTAFDNAWYRGFRFDD